MTGPLWTLSQGVPASHRNRIDLLVQAAGQTASAGQWQKAEKLWGEVLALAPNHFHALHNLGIYAFQRGDKISAIDFLRRAQQIAPGDPTIPTSLAVVLRESNDAAGEWQAISQALAIDPYWLPALLAKAGFQERKGEASAAAQTYRNCLKIAPPEHQWPPTLRLQLSHGRKLAAHHTERLTAVLKEAISELQPENNDRYLRWLEAASILAGRTQPYHSECNQLQIPRLPAIPFYPRALFPWMGELEYRTEAIRAELQALLEQDEGFTPYVAYKPGQPVNQWSELNHSPRWNAYHLWQHGEPIKEHIARCPETANALNAVDKANIDGMAPNVMFSILAPHTHIPPHNGETNARLVAHLPLIVPEHCSLRVGFEQRGWIVGEGLVFDDSIEHEARNDSDHLRAVLIFDVWNPLLDTNEREIVNRMTIAVREYRGD